jgi:hypothetical protein
MTRISASFVLLVFILVFMSTAQETCNTGANSTGWYLGDNYMFKPYDPAGGVKFAAAQSYCQGLLSGVPSGLAIVDSNNINYVASMMGTWFTVNTQTWVNLTRTGAGSAPDQGWLWSMGGVTSALNSSLWASGQPDGCGDYGAMGLWAHLDLM